MNKSITISRESRIFELPTYFINSSSSTISQRKFLGLTYTGGAYKSFGTSAKCVGKTTPAHLCIIDKIVSRLPTQNKNVRTCTKAVQSDLLSQLDKLFDTADAPYYSQCLFRLIADYQTTDDIDYANMAYVVSQISVALEELQYAHKKTLLKLSA